ncbi:MAG: endo-1,4-beta-xylanase [Phycisphaerales bacterium]|nr:MAG: endo-1,4-beta-xylanase [Phycisphaerales bacterium]
MNRRDFLKTAGLGTASLAMPASLLTARQRDNQQPKERVLARADERIEKYRKGRIMLRIVGPDGKPLASGAPVKIKQTRHKFLFGCNIFKLNRCRTAQDNAAYEKHFASLLNFATLPFYWWNYTRQRGKPDDARTDEIVRWCKAHNVTTKGHPLAWNYSEARWLPDEPEEAMQEQLKRIDRCARRFQGDINIWDVVNEATHYDRDQCKKNAPKLTEAIRRMGIGAYVRAAFETARKANPKATLIINDYRTDEAYVDKVITELVDENRGPLYDVIGIQSHMHGRYWGAQRAWEVCERYAKFGKPLHFTETTVVSGPREASGWVTTPEGEKRQAEQVVEFYRVLFSHPAVEAITWWDFTDQNAWQRAPAGLVRADMTPKPAYEQLQNLIKGQWWTDAETKITADGGTRLHGFYGDYEVTALHQGRKLSGAFSFDRQIRERVNVQLG